MTTTTDATYHMRINKHTLVPVGVAVAIVLCVASGVSWYWADRMADANVRHKEQIEALEKDNQINAALDDIRGQLESINHRLEQTASRQWLRRDQKQWVDLLRFKNPELTVPDIDDIE